MKAWLCDLRDVALLRSEAFARLSRRPDAFLLGFLAVVLVALIIGLPALVADLSSARRPAEPADMTAALGQMRQALRSAVPALDALGVPAAARDQALEAAARSFELGFRLGSEIAALPTPLPRPLGVFFRAVGDWASRPFGDSRFPLAVVGLGTWLGYGLWVMLFAKLSGGRGTLRGFFGATGFFALPHLLHLFDRVPVAGGILGAIAFVWGLLIYVRATAVSHELPVERAVLVVALPLIVAGVLAALLLPVVVGLIVLLAVA